MKLSALVYSTDFTHFNTLILSFDAMKVKFNFNAKE